MFLNSRGGSRINALLYLLITSLAIYIAVKAVPPYYAYYSMEDEVRHQMHLALINPQDVIYNDIWQKARELELPIQKEDIILTKNDDGSMSVNIKWETDVDFGYGFHRKFPFEIKANSKEPEK